MAIPLFTGDVGSSVAPIQPPVESLQVSGYTKGLEASKLDPGTIGSIAKGITAGIDKYQEVRGNALDIEQKEVNLEQDQLRLDAQRELQPEAIAADRAKLIESRRAFAEATRLRQQEEELFGVLKGDDPTAKVDAVTSGKYAEIFAKAPNLEKYAIKVAAPFMPDAVRSAFIQNESAKQAQRLAMQNRAALEKSYTDTVTTLQSSDLMSDALVGNPGANIIDLAKDIDFVPSGRYNYKDGLPERDPATGRLKENQLDPTTAPKTFDAISRKTGKVIAQGVMPEEKKLVNKALALSLQIGGDFEDTDVARTLKASRGEPSTPKTQPGQQGAPAPTPQNANRGQALDSFLNGKPAAPQSAQPAQAAKPISLQDYEKGIAKTNFVAADGTFSVKANPQLPAMFARATGVEPAVAMKYQEEIGTILSMLEESPDIINNPRLRQSRIEQIATARDRFIRGILAEDFKAKGDTVGIEFNDVAVKAHNRRAAEARAAISSFSGAGAPRVTSASDLIEVSSPEELYVSENYDRISQRIESLLSLTASAAQAAANAQLKKGATAARVVNIVKAYK